MCFVQTFRSISPETVKEHRKTEGLGWQGGGWGSRRGWGRVRGGADSQVCRLFSYSSERNHRFRSASELRSGVRLARFASHARFGEPNPPAQSHPSTRAGGQDDVSYTNSLKLSPDHIADSCYAVLCIQMYL